MIGRLISFIFFGGEEMEEWREVGEKRETVMEMEERGGMRDYG